MNGTMTLNDVYEALWYVPKKRHVPHPLESEFKKRGIRPDLLANFLGVTEVAVRSWLRGSMAVPTKREQELQAVWAKVLQWERINGRLFNSQAPQRKAVKNNGK